GACGAGAPGARGGVAAIGAGAEPLFAGWRVVAADGTVLESGGQSRVAMRVGTHELFADLDAFFQANRFLVETLFDDVRGLATGASGPALDAYGGGGLLPRRLLLPGVGAGARGGDGAPGGPLRE